MAVALSSLLVPAWAPMLARAQSPAPPQATGPEAPTDRWIDEKVLGAHLRFLADDLLEGRGVGTRGDELAQAYLESQFRLAGLVPGGPDGAWRQPVPLVGYRSRPRGPLVVETGSGSDERRLEFAWSDQFVAGIDGGRAEARWSACEFVFVGYGIEAPEERWDDYQGAELDGKVLVFLNNDPSHDPELFAGARRLYYGRWSYKYEIAARKRAAGALVIHTTPSAGYGWNVVQSSFTRESFDLAQEESPRTEIRGWLTEEAARSLFAFGGHDYDALVERAQTRAFAPVPLGVRASLAMDAEVRQIASANVCGLLPGSDPTRSEEIVVISSHFDHLGRNPELEGDTIYNGAVDNASGCAGLLTVARAFQLAGSRPRRSLLFLAVTAEESGLLGSRYFAQDPPVPRERLVACLNIDSLARFGAAHDVAVIGLGKTDLDADVEAVAAAFGRRVVGDLEPDKGRFYRSDQFSFARVGVPAIFLGPGMDLLGSGPDEGARKVQRWTLRHYHQPSDEWSEDWDLTGAVADLRLLARLAQRVCDREDPPRWTPGDEFERLRPARGTRGR